ALDDHPVAGLDEGDGPTLDGHGSDVADAEAVGAAREAALGHERCVRAPTRTLHGTRDGEHLAHARTALRSLVADDDNVTGVDAATEDLLHGLVLAIEHAGRALEAELVEPGDLHHAAVGRQRAAQDGESAL